MYASMMWSCIFSDKGNVFFLSFGEPICYLESILAMQVGSELGEFVCFVITFFVLEGMISVNDLLVRNVAFDLGYFDGSGAFVLSQFGKKIPEVSVLLKAPRFLDFFCWQ